MRRGWTSFIVTSFCSPVLVVMDLQWPCPFLLSRKIHVGCPCSWVPSPKILLSVTSYHELDP